MINKDRWEELREGHSSKIKERVHEFYIHPGSGNGDVLYNTCREIIDKDEHDEWAYAALEAVFKCLDEGKRWADHMIPYIPAAQWRDQYDMTQDPWLLAYCCAVHLGRQDLIEKYKPSIKVFNLPDKWAWRRALLGKWNMYWLWRIVTPHRLLQHFVYVFYGYMDEAYKKRRGN